MDNKLYKLMNWPDIEAVIYSESDHPENVLGCHEVNGGFLIQAFFPNAVSVKVRNLTNDKESILELVDEEGFFAGLFNVKSRFPYEYVVEYLNDTVTKPEVYSYIPKVWGAVADKFMEGNLPDAYKYFGAHFCERKGILGTEFITYAPNALRVSAVGDFNHWDGRVTQMVRLTDSGIFGVFVPGLSIDSLYKFEMKVKGGLTFLKRDPFAFKLEAGPNDANMVANDYDYAGKIYKRTEKPKTYNYELVNLKSVFSSGDFYKFVDNLIKKEINTVVLDNLSAWTTKVVTENGVVSNFSFNENDYSVSDIKKFVTYCHEKDIKVLISINFATFIPDNGGLIGYDGSHLFEEEKNIHDNQLNYDLKKPFVTNYLTSVADFYMSLFEFDGLCYENFDRMYWLDYCIDSPLISNIYGGKESVEAYNFIKALNTYLRNQYKNIILSVKYERDNILFMMPPEKEGFGFDFKVAFSKKEK